jgi:hypothetical protein
MMKLERKENFKIVLIATVMIAVFLGLLIANIIKIEKIWFVFPIMTIRISTVITAMFSFMLVLFLQRNKSYKAFYYASLAVIFSMGLYEIVWYYIAAGFRGYEMRIFEFGALLGWVFLGVREVISKRPSKLSTLFYGIFMFSIVLWVGTGFVFNNIENSSISISGEILNITSKASLAIAYSLHIGTES